jgi:hypothetical protein
MEIWTDSLHFFIVHNERGTKQGSADPIFLVSQKISGLGSKDSEDHHERRK